SPFSTLFVYRLMPASLERARRQGIPVARVPGFLGQITGAPVPRSVEAALARWETRGAEARLERAVLLRLSSEELMAQVTASPLTRRFIREQLGPATALVREQDWLRLVAALGEMGLLPDVFALEEDDAG
ncbi:MAG: helicase-associated domain-containing protein, partial [Chloroflexota bacterium]|nr:helicase-associated domain-containing protein [Chloroflexota bacterium]